MGRKGGKYKKKGSDSRLSNSSSRRGAVDDDMMNDEIDAFHKNRDVVSLNADEDMLDSDDDSEQPVLEFEDDKDEEKEEEDEDNDVDDEENDKGLAAKIVRTQKYLQSKFGGVDDEITEDADEEEEEQTVWGRKKDMYGADVDHELQSSDDEDAVAEEREVEKLQLEKAKLFSMDDFGLEDANQDETDAEPTFEELEHGKIPFKGSYNTRIRDEDDMTYSLVKKDLNALTKEEQMDVVYSSAPELVGLLSELDDALDQLEKNVNPLVDKVRGQDSLNDGKLHYLEVKQLLLQSYCQAIAFYLLLKSEGLPARVHPVVSRLVEIKSLLDKMKKMDANLPFNLEFVLDKNVKDIAIRKLVEGDAEPESDSFPMSSELLSSKELQSVKELAVEEAGELTNKSSQKHDPEQANQEEQVGLQSVEMLKVRASLEENLRKRGLYNSITPKHHSVREPLQPVSKQFETIDDFVDETMKVDVVNQSNSRMSSLHIAPRSNKRKVISGDDDIPRRDDIGIRRRKYEMRVLTGAGIDSVDAETEIGDISADGVDVAGEESDPDSDLEYYNQMERQHAAKLASKSDKYSRTTEAPSLPDTAVDGKRHITRQIEKNRGLTRTRKKLTKNPRKKYKLKHKKAEIRRKGQVRDIRKPAGPYGGEASGINKGVSRSIRFKN